MFLYFLFCSLLAPIFREVSVFGFKFQQKLDDLKAHVDAQLTVLKNDIRTFNTFQPQIIIPPTDAQLPLVKKMVDAAMAEEMRKYGFKSPPVQVPTVDQDVSLLFATRYKIEKELHRIAGLDSKERQQYSIFRLLMTLQSSGILDARLMSALNGVVAICSPAIHGEEVTPAQINFVRDIAPGLIGTLKAIPSGQDIMVPMWSKRTRSSRS